MMLRLVLCIFAFILATPAVASHAPVQPRLVVTVSLSKHAMTIQKFSKSGPKVITAWIVPVAPGTIRPGTYKLERMTEDYQSRHGNVKIKNVVRTNGRFNLRSSEMFSEWIKGGRPANKSIVLSAEDGSMLFTTIRTFGLEKTVLRVIP